MSNGKRAPTKFKKARCCSVAKTTDCLLYELDWNTYMSDLAFWISLDFFLFNTKPDFECSKTKINKQEAHHRELSYSSSLHHHLYFSISSLLQSWCFTSVPPGHTLLPQLITNKSSQKNICMMMTKSMPYIRLTSITTVQTSAVCSYHSSMSMIEKNAKS